MYLFKLIFNKENDSKIIYLCNNWSVSSERFNEICKDVIEKVKINNKMNLDEFLNRMDWEYGFKATEINKIVEIECENIINLDA